MKRLTTLILLSTIISITSTRAQKFERVVDRITGKTTLYTAFETIYRKAGVGEAGEKVSFSFFKINDTLFLCLDIRLGGYKVFGVKEGQSLYLKTSKAQPIILPAASTQLSQLDNSKSVQASYLTQMYRLTSNDIESLRNGSVSAIRIENTDGHFDYEIKDKFSGLFAKVLSK